MCLVRRLAAVAVVTVTAAALVSAQPADEPGPKRWPNHEELEYFLKKAKVIERKKLGKGITNPDKVTLELDGVVRHAIYKRIDKQHDSWRNEVGAYELDKLLGLGMVPPTVKRSIGGRRGCLQLWVTGTVMFEYDGEFPDMDRWREQVSVMWLFDDLIANIDRHLNNAMVSPDHRLMLIDNSKTFRYEKKLINDLNATGTGTHARFWGVDYDENRERYNTRYPPELVERLRALSEDDLKRAIKKVIWGQNRKLVAKRLELILERIESMEAIGESAANETDSDTRSQPTAAP